jgi:hypothetical protein
LRRNGRTRITDNGDIAVALSAKISDNTILVRIYAGIAMLIITIKK